MSTYMNENQTKWRMFFTLQKRYVKEGQREGQSLMNALAGVDWKLYLNFTNTDADCFYNDAKVTEFNARLMKEWSV